MKWNVSYQLNDWRGLCGNKECGSEQEARDFIRDNQSNWQSHSVYTYTPHWSGITTETTQVTL